MNYRMVMRILSRVLFCLAALLVPPMIAAICFGESVLPFAITIFIAAALGFILDLFKPRTSDLYARDGFAAVGLAWMLMSAVGALPFVISGDIPHYIDALFETVSGLTTTGASILVNVEALSRGCSFWRMFTHWIGGMGVLVFIMAVLPMSGEHSMHIMRAEVPGPTVGKLVPRVRSTASILYFIYIGLTVLETIFLLCGGMSFFDALLHAFASAGTGGFSTNAASIGGFDSLYIEMVIAAFLVLFGINFNLYYLILIGRAKDALRSEELHVFFGIILAATLSIGAGITKMYGGFSTALRHSFFNVMTIVSTAGFGTQDYTKWPEFTKAILVMLMFIGGCAGSTGGGLKLSRVMLLIKGAAADLRQVINPRRVTRVQLDGKRVDNRTVKAAYTYFTLYMLLLVLISVIVSFDGYDITTNFTAAISCLSNVGPGMSLIGPTGNFSIFSYPSRIVMIVAMLIGRLEIYPMLILISPGLWRKK